MFAATINPEDAHSVFDSVAALVDECKLHVTEDGLSVTAVDPANVGMVDVQMPASCFETYEGDEHTIGLPLDRFLDIVELFVKQTEDSPLRVMLDEQTRRLRLECAGLDYTLGLIDPDSIRKEPDIPDLDLAAELTMDTSHLQRAIKASGMVSKHLVLSSSADSGFVASAQGDTDDVTVDVEPDDLIEFNGGSSESMYSLDYLQDIVAPIPDSVPVTLQLGDSLPAMVRFKLLDGAVTVLYILAPRIAND